MLDLTDIKYKCQILMENGQKMDITNAVVDLGWEENEGELATRITANIRNLKVDDKYISSYAKLGCMILVTAKSGQRKELVARGTIVDWETSVSNSTDRFQITCYDELYNLQQSQDNVFISDGTTTKNAIEKIFKKWNIPMAKYDGPKETHGKLIFKRDNLSDIILSILDDAVKDGAKKSIIRCTNGKISILERGSNSEVFIFTNDITSIVSSKQTTAGMVTRVKIIGQENKEGKSKVEETLDGKVEFGIRQRIYVRQSSETIKKAKSAAKEILSEKGKVKKTFTVESLDVPFIRKGDLVQIRAGRTNSEFYVIGIRHSAKGTMMMDLEKVKELDKSKEEKNKDNTKFKVGDTVVLNGAVYIDSYASKKGKNFSNRTCKITRVVDLSRKCPYHVDVIGWVTPESIKKK